ncbi:MFS transporter [uncultured Streptomyces sp.]|uniref:MFS transporter n=1 Tax=uncultured Streptomyces sp. TaxID=174707 RepID=UPI0026155AE3|nr:MFS transporter [uncultured Streptomyces sp.]
MLKKFVRDNFSTLTGPARTLGVLHFLDSMGNGLFLSGSAVYFVLVADLPVATVGLGLSLAGFSGFLSSVLLGRMTDRTGARRLLSILLFLLAGAYTLYPLVDSAVLFFPLVILIGALEFGCGPAFGALVMDLIPEKDRVTARAALRSLFNVGFTIGTLVSALLIGLGGAALQALPLGNGLTFLLAAALVLTLPATLAKPAGGGRGRFRALRDRPFLAVVGASSLLALHSAVLLVGIPLWIVRGTSLPHGIVPLVMGVNTVLVVLFQVAASRGSDTLDGAVTAARRAGLVSALACVALAVGGGFGNVATGAVVLVAVLLLTLAELWQSASGFGLGFGLAPEHARGEYLGAFHLHMVIQATIGPAAVSLLVVGHETAGWLAVGLIFLVGVAAIGPSVARARRGVESPAADAAGADAPAA